MVQPSSAAFQAARFDDTNRPTYTVEIDRGNYAWNGEGASATATSEFSADFPAAGTINGDRTALNYGPASGAENDIGKSGWRAAGVILGTTVYNGDVFPESATPPWSAVGDFVTRSLLVDGGRTVLQQQVSAPLNSTYSYERTGAAANAIGNVLEATGKYISGSFFQSHRLMISDGTKSAKVNIFSDHVELVDNLAGGTISVTNDSTLAYKTYRLTLVGSTAQLFIDSVLVATLGLAAPTTSVNNVSFSGFTSVFTGDVSVFRWDTVRHIKGATQSLTVLFGQLRPVNRAVLYFHPTLTDGVPSDFVIETSPDGTIFTTQATITGNTARKIVSTFTQVNATHLRISINSASGDGKPVILEAEVYATVDISDRIIGLRLSRRREFTQNRYLAAEMTLTVSNVDFFFSPRYTPKTTDVGFFNSEWRPNMPVRVKVGFSNENLPQFDGVIDRIEQQAETRTATIKCRDRLKQSLQRKVSAKLQSGLSLEGALIRLANFANIATQDIVVDTSTISFAQFFPQDVNIYDEMVAVIQSAGDAVLYMDESGILRFKMFLNSVPQTNIWDLQPDWEQAGTQKYNVSTSVLPGSLRVDQLTITVGPFTYPADALPEASTPVWTFLPATGGAGAIQAREINPAGQHHVRLFAANGSADTATVVYRRTDDMVTKDQPGASIEIKVKLSTAGVEKFGEVELLLASQNRFSSCDIDFWNNAISLSGQFATQTITEPSLSDGAFHVIRLEWIVNTSTVRVLYDGVLKMTATNTDNYGIALPRAQWSFQSRGNLGSGGDILDVRVDYVIWNMDTLSGQGTYVTQEVDLSADVQSYDTLEVIEIPNPAVTTQAFIKVADVSGGPYQYFTIPIHAPIIGVPIKRFVRIGLTFGADVVTGNPVVQRMDFFWKTRAGSLKVTPTSVLTVRSSDILLRFSTSLTDETGGASPLINRSVVKANPFYLDVSAVTAWEATVGGQPLSGSNTLTLPIGDTVFNLDYGDFLFDVPQTVNFTKTGGAVTTSLTNHPNKPVLTVTVSGSPATFTALNTSAKKFIQRGTVIAVSLAEDKFVQEFGTREEVIENNYIQNSRMAQTIAATRITAFKKPQELAQATVRILPDLQLQDRLTVVEINTGTNADYQLVGMDHNLAVSGDSLMSETSMTAIAVPT